MNKIHEVAIKKNWKQRGFSFDIQTDHCGKKWENNSHRVDQLLLLVSGEMKLTVNKKTLHPKIGEEILIPAQTTHSVENVGKKSNRWFYGYKNKK